MTAPGSQLSRATRALLGGASDLLLPAVCLSCNAAPVTAEGLCDACNVKLLSLVAMAYCPRCGSSLGPGLPVREEGCWSCPTPLGRFTGVVRLGPYDGPLRSAVRQLKYRRQEALSRRLGDMLSRAVSAACEGETFDAVIPTAAHWLRRFGRGGDHARRLACIVAGALDVPVGDELVRVRHTPPQAHLSRTQRIDNMRGAFAVRRTRTITGANVLLIDDVTTTGATANEAAKALLTGGALRVTLGVIAKGGSPVAYTEQPTT